MFFYIYTDEKKTIKPASAGGQGNMPPLSLLCRPLIIFTAGGQKYIVQGIFFKFALGVCAA